MTAVPRKERKWWEKREEPTTIWQACKTKEGLDYYFNTQTNETQWEKPEELMTPEELNKTGNWQWVPDEKECFIPGKVLDTDGKKATVELEDGTTRVVKKSTLEPLQRSSLQRIPEDLVLLDSMTAPLILHCLRKRFEQDKIYTAVGTILISVNPYIWLDIYNQDVIKKYKRHTIDEDLPPHVFNIAHDAYYGITAFKQHQSIIISGESGAGKTEATKQCLSYIAAIAGSVGGVEKKVLQANPILEAFGNAKTLRNDNSSRFGKFIEVYFNPKGIISGAQITNYLLEKIRVVHQTQNERNFHIFYQLTKAASKDQRATLCVGAASDYKYIKTCTDVATIDDHRDFKDVTEAFKDLVITPEEQMWLYGIVSVVLNLGNIVFEETASGAGGTKVNPSSNTIKYVENVSKLLQVEGKALHKALTIRELRIKGQSTTLVDLSGKEASDTRNALAKFIYGNMFDWLVQRINLSMGQPTKDKTTTFIGILDIFGFEIFKHNSFEQLCINFTNEMLQQHFNNQTFKLEEAVYTAEKIVFKHVEFIDNQPMLDLITKKPTGVLPLLDEELVMPQGTDKTFMGKLHKFQASNAVYKQIRQNPEHFIIKHYAGEVTYDANGFLEKNRDTLTEDLLDLLHTSTNVFIKKLYPEDKKMTSAERKYSLSKQFQSQLQDLMYALGRTEPHYIRCVKPNDDKAPKKFVSVNCMEQLTYSGVFEAVAIRKQGFPFRMKHKEFVDRYSCIFSDANGVLTRDFSGQSEPDICEQIVKELKLDRTNTQMGLTRVLYRADEYKRLELIRSIKARTMEVNEALHRLCSVDVNSFENKEAKEEYFQTLARAVVEADEFRLKSKIAEKAREMLEKFIEERMDPETKKQLEVAHKKMERKLLEEVLAVCDREGYRTKLTAACREMLEKIVDAEEALEVAMKEVNEEFLRKALEMCDEFGFNSKVVQSARTLLNNLVRAQAMCKRAKETMNHVHLQKTIEFCDGFGYDSPLVKEIKYLYQQITKARALLLEAKEKVEQGLLEQAIRGCDIVSYKGELVEECRGLLKRVTRINEEVKLAKESLDETHIMFVVRAADEIKMKGSKELVKFRKLLNGSRDAFLAAQYAKAKKRKDHVTAIRVALRRKDRFIAASEGKYELTKWPGLKPADEWAGEKFWGSREKRRIGFLKWQEAEIHSNLTLLRVEAHMAAVCKEKAVENFQTIQEAMGQKKSKGLLLRVHDLLVDGFRIPKLADEIYIGIMKQLTENPDPTAVSKGWELMSLCLCVFPPTEELENYMETWLRKEKDRNEMFHTTGLLRKRLYHGRKEQAPFRGDILKMQKKLQEGTKEFDDIQTTKKITYADLKKSFYHQDDDIDDADESVNPKASEEDEGDEKRKKKKKKKNKDKDKEKDTKGEPVSPKSPKTPLLDEKHVASSSSSSSSSASSGSSLPTLSDPSEDDSGKKKKKKKDKKKKKKERRDED